VLGTGEQSAPLLPVLLALGVCRNLFRVFGTVPGSDEATLLESTKTPNR